MDSRLRGNERVVAASRTDPFVPAEAGTVAPLNRKFAEACSHASCDWTSGAMQGEPELPAFFTACSFRR